MLRKTRLVVMAEVLSLSMAATVVYADPIHDAARIGDVKTLARLLAEGVDVDGHNDNQETPLFIAAQGRHVETVAFLLSSGAKPNAARRDNQTPLFPASRDGDVEIVSLLLENGANPSWMADRGRSPLNSAIVNAHFEVVSLLVANGADVNRAAEGGTPLVVAARDGHADIVALLLSSGAEVKRGFGDQVPLNVASENGHVEVVRSLLEYGADVNTAINRGPLFLASRAGHTDVVELLLSNDAEISEFAIRTAAEEGHEDIAQMLRSAYDLALGPTAIPQIDYPDEIVSSTLSGVNAFFSLTTRFIEAGGTVGYEVSAVPRYRDTADRTGSYHDSLRTVVVEPGGSEEDSFSTSLFGCGVGLLDDCPGPAFVNFCGGTIEIAWRGQDTNGNAVALDQKVRVVCR